MPVPVVAIIGTGQAGFQAAASLRQDGFAGRVALIGDAAHAVSPNSGQGASLALEDALCLAQTLRGAVPAPRAFAQFEALRRERVENIIAYGRRAGEDTASDH